MNRAIYPFVHSEALGSSMAVEMHLHSGKALRRQWTNPRLASCSGAAVAVRLKVEVAGGLPELNWGREEAGMCQTLFAGPCDS